MIFLNFLRDWLPLILPLVDFVIGLIIILVVNKSDLSDVKKYILEKLPEVVSTVEQAYDNGYISKEIKKETAVALSISDASIKYGSLSRKNITALTKFVDKNIESILSTPQKKNKEV